MWKKNSWTDIREQSRMDEANAKQTPPDLLTPTIPLIYACAYVGELRKESAMWL
jgi:hypothetical protein